MKGMYGMKKILSLAICAVMIMSLFVGCGGGNSDTSTPDTSDVPENSAAPSSDAGGEPSGDKIKIRMAYWNSEDTVADLLSFLAEAVPDVEIEFQYIDNSNYATVIDTQLSANEGPDIFCETAASTLKHAQLGYSADLSELGALYSDAGTSILTYDGKVYALPGISWFEGIWYNKDIFADNNIELPKTFDEYIAICKKFQELGIKPLSAGLKSWEPMLKNSMAFVTAEYLSTDAGKNFGADYREGKTTLDGVWNPYLEKWSDMINEGVYTTDMTGIDHEQALNEFATGGSAMFCSGPWDLEAIQSKNPDLNLGMFPFYGTEESDGWLIGGPGFGFAANAKSENLDAAMRVLTALSTPEGQEAMWAGNAGGSSYLKGVEFELPEVYNDAATALAAGNVYCPWNEWGEAGSAHQDYGVEMQSYLLGEDLSTCLQNVDRVVAELIAK